MQTTKNKITITDKTPQLRFCKKQ